jgi:glutamate formiminotransferase
MIEAIPNVSEGRDATVIRAMEEAIRAVPGILFLGSAPDPDHNRTVYTYAASAPFPLVAATRALFELAVENIDLRTQRGEHPRVGAVDVIPFVPLAGSTMEECIDTARSVGALIASEFQVPVFLYEYAANGPSRRTLPELRSGGLSRLTEKMSSDEWRPDYGPPHPHETAGVSIVGARRPLIAFNVQLASDDLEAAAAIARAVRESSGGLAALRAIPIRLSSRGVVQVSMNLVDYGRTSLWEAYQAVSREAGARGIGILSSEIIGLVPAEALSASAAEAMQIENFSLDLVLENRIEGRRVKSEGSEE